MPKSSGQNNSNIDKVEVKFLCQFAYPSAFGVTQGRFFGPTESFSPKKEHVMNKLQFWGKKESKQSSLPMKHLVFWSYGLFSVWLSTCYQWWVDTKNMK